MRKRQHNYRIVDKLPATAMTVQEFADSQGYSNMYVYNQWRDHVGDKKKVIPFEIIVFRNMNFVIPQKAKICTK